MDQPYLLLSLRYAWDGMERCVHPVLLFGEGTRFWLTVATLAPWSSWKRSFVPAASCRSA